MKKHSSTFLKLKEISFNAYAPYSQLRVSTLIKFHNGQEVCGVNFENKSYGATICAERCAIGNALTLGCDLKTACGIYLYASRSE